MLLADRIGSCENVLVYHESNAFLHSACIQEARLDVSPHQRQRTAAFVSLVSGIKERRVFAHHNPMVDELCAG